MTTVAKWTAIALVLASCPDKAECFFDLIGEFIGSLVKPIFGLDRIEEEAERGRQAVETGISTMNGNIATSLRNLDNYVKNDIIPQTKILAESGTKVAESVRAMAYSADKLVNGVTEEVIPAATETMGTARRMMEEVTTSTKHVTTATVRFIDGATDNVIPETVKTLEAYRKMMKEVVTRFGQSLDNVDYMMELVIVLLFILAAVLCGRELQRMSYVLRPTGFVALETQLLKWTRVVCFGAILLLTVHIILKVLKIHVFSKPEQLLVCLLLPGVPVVLYVVLYVLFYLLYLLYILAYYGFFFVKYLLSFPYFVTYYLLLAPFVWTYVCFVNRQAHRNRIGAAIIYCMPITFASILYECKDFIEYVLEATKPGQESSSSNTEQEDYSLAWLYSAVFTFLLFYCLAIVLRLCYPPPSQAIVIRGPNRR